MRMGVHGAGAVLGHPGRSPRGLMWGQEQRLRAPAGDRSGAEVPVWVPGRGFSGRLWGGFCLCKDTWKLLSCSSVASSSATSKTSSGTSAGFGT